MLMAFEPTDRGQMSVIQPHAERAQVLEALGQPDSSREETGKRVDVFETMPGGLQRANWKNRAALFASGLPFYWASAGLLMAFIMERPLVGGAPYCVYTITYSLDDKVESVSETVKHSLLWPASQDSELGESSSACFVPG
jgi:hypothetical protein